MESTENPEAREDSVTVNEAVTEAVGGELPQEVAAVMTRQIADMPVGSLPKDMWSVIFSNLSQGELGRLADTNPQLHQQVNAYRSEVLVPDAHGVVHIYTNAQLALALRDSTITRLGVHLPVDVNQLALGEGRPGGGALPAMELFAGVVLATAADGELRVMEGARITTVNGATVTVTVNQGGIVDTVADGRVSVYIGGKVGTASGGEILVYDGGEVATVNGDALGLVYDGGSVNTVKDGTMSVETGGRVATVEGGTIEIKGGTVDKVTGGEVEVWGTVNLVEGGNVYVQPTDGDAPSGRVKKVIGGTVNMGVDSVVGGVAGGTFVVAGGSMILGPGVELTVEEDNNLAYTLGADPDSAPLKVLGFVGTGFELISAEGKRLYPPPL
ncbi:MAG: hypothetical protein H0T78_02005 [Longispora sp.]|nr:hypothetical protein [Longispora sp. (in: high G+C Gram-positive bacteria)]